MSAYLAVEHASEESLEAYARGQLDLEAMRKMEAHLADCPKCLDRLRQLGDFLDGFEGLRASTSPPG